MQARGVGFTQSAPTSPVAERRMPPSPLQKRRSYQARPPPLFPARPRPPPGRACPSPLTAAPLSPRRAKASKSAGARAAATAAPPRRRCRR